MILNPRVPKTIDYECGENDSIKRICVCINPIDCIRSLQPNIFCGRMVLEYK